MSLYGRDTELEKWGQLLSPRSPIRGIAIEAIGGMGKTALARELCIRQGVWDSFEFVLGAQAVKSQIRIDPRDPIGKPIVENEDGVRRLREFLIVIADQLKLNTAKFNESQLETDLEIAICRKLHSHSALFMLDNLETMTEAKYVLTVLHRMCLPPFQKALITTRSYPGALPPGFQPIALEAITDPDACRNIIVSQLDRAQFSPDLNTSNAINQIREIAAGHPLALELLSGKLITQGIGAITSLHAEWTRENRSALSDEYTSALLRYVFDKRFLEFVGPAGRALLVIIARQGAGIEEEAIQFAAFHRLRLSNETFENVLRKLFNANCIRKQIGAMSNVLTMHSLTRGFFMHGVM
jgi:hypothetical protein